MAEKSRGEESDLLEEGRRLFARAADEEAENRDTYEKDFRFARLGEQWPSDIKAQREKEQRPALTVNKLPPFIRQVVNDARLNKPQIKVHPADSQADVATAEVLNGIIRNIEYTSQSDIAYDTAIDCSATGGIGYLRVDLDYAYSDSFDLDVRINRVSNPLSIYGDPDGRGADGLDWNNAFVTERMTEKAFKSKFGDAEMADFSDTGAWADVAPIWRDKDGPLVAEWWNREEKKVDLVKLSNGTVREAEELGRDGDAQQMIEMGLIKIEAKRKGVTHKVTQRIMTGMGIIETKEWPGCYIPLIPVYGDEFELMGKRYWRSLIHNAVDAQRNLNYWRSAATELVALAPKVPYIGPEGAFDVDTEKWATASSVSWPYIQYSKDAVGPPQRQMLDTGGAAGAIQQAMLASDDMKSIIGIYDASLGQRSNETSGKAIMARQREGDVSTFHFIDNLARAIRHTGIVLVDLIPKVYTGPRVMRIMGEEGIPSNVKVNQPYAVGAPSTPPSLTAPPQQPGPPMTPMTPMPQASAGTPPEMNDAGKVIMAMHDLAVGKYDVVVVSGPSYTSRRAEAAAEMTELIRAYPEAAPIIGDKLAQNMDWPGAQEIAGRFEKLLPQAIKGDAPLPPEILAQIEEGKALIAKLTQENQAMKSSVEADQARVQGQLALQKQKQDGEMALEVRKMGLERDKDALAMGGSEVIGPDGQPVVKSGPELVLDALGRFMQQLTMQQAIATQQVLAQGQATQQALGEVVSLLRAPVVAVRDATGRISGAQRVVPGNKTVN